MDHNNPAAQVPPRRVADYPPDLVRLYKEAGIWGDLSIPGEFHRVAERNRDRPAVVTPEAALTYAELDQSTDQIAYGLGDLGLRPGDPVLFQIGNRIETVLAWYGCLKAGLIPVCTLALHRGHEISQISRRAGAVAHLVEGGTEGFDLVAFGREQAAGHPTLRALIVVGTHPAAGLGDAVRFQDLGSGVEPAKARQWVEQVQAGIDPGDVAVFQLSGGTTGVPKVIPRRHAEYWYNAAAYARAWGWDVDSRITAMGPIVHNAGIVCSLHGAHSVGACLLLGNGRLEQTVPFFAAQKATHLMLGRAAYSAFEHPAFAGIVPTLQRVILTGGKVPARVFEAYEELGLWSGQLFGMGEGLFMITFPGSPRGVRAGTVGTVLSPHDRIRILEPGGEDPVPDGQVGELCCQGPYTIRGYYDADEHNERAFTGDGFYRTGDLAAIVEIDGVRCVTVEGRIKDLINRGGEKVNAEEVELLLVRHPAIAAAALVAMPDPRLGERACAYLVARDEPVGLASVRHHLEGLGVAKYKWPERLEWVDEFPATRVGKIDKQRLRREIAEKMAAETGATDR
ncbi:(2,3-dihydroxybenzoyl)adenylate synthase [Actinomadura montaniterrae]|uniref:AMP-binding protein n=1 Tax=Actinomadura montaniterrae TaxID=1803903 RepID=A0A6L3VZE5_9ACTN|nr:AMP-binding protein [Actinomadura montaniterrae]KAB2384828.1 AMP-binding protein [Actinomadura montaniterrae]